MKYRVEVLPKAADVIRKLDPSVKKRIVIRINWLSEHLDMLPHQMLTGSFKGMFKNRMGDYRILYSIDRQQGIMFVHKVGHRRDVYDE